ncbi:MAG: hypothetical protein GF317_04835 [Candidatus Lokiarchaeota archaeon]|nr:hypothetical protein [Candidatus Lokiarchaeota archaeon]
MALNKYTGIFNFLFRNTVNINRRIAGISDSGDVANAQNQVASDVQCKIKLNNVTTGSKADNSEAFLFPNSSHVGYFFKNQDIKINDTLIDGNDKYKVLHIDDKPSGINKYKKVYLEKTVE